MSRLGKLPVEIPANVTVTVGECDCTVKSGNVALKTLITGDVSVTVSDGKVWVKPANDSKRARAMWGTVRANILNLVKGVTQGFSKTLELNGVGFRAALQGNVLGMSLGYSHEIRYVVPAGITVKVQGNNIVTLSGADKQQVGQVAADIRALRKPDHYKLKSGDKTNGVRYQGEYVHVKEGKKK